ncbi:gamma-glutamylcyclotransferase [Rhodobaculum claviforme]|uniref:Gamma-glutamylcyclotransferase n=1 Tax=Rhodobaculum claviforme TaxID=1549854 RepID=A0A934WI53_9RHOB|nr:gamma-glutamylcyclotransferase [Rhodobaculum claviforme]MBK5926387.1 gamma-glutamylcyclotransferase [Rhodobaculum claviforme]
MSEPFFFGYGSLVNRRTHDYAEAYSARVRGWRRVWRHTDMRDTAFLSVERDPDAEIEGLIALVPGGDWRALDVRESGYDRVALSEGLAHGATRPVAAQIYAIPSATGAPTLRQPILLSYLDVVVQGFLTEFGEAGVARFFASTRGWGPILDDRARPRYPRAQALSARERGLVDAALAPLGVRRVTG